MAMIRASFVLIMSMIILNFSLSHGYKFNVGGKDGWGVKPSKWYGPWSEKYRFQINDTLYFKYTKGSDSVLVVSKQDYYSCNIGNPIQTLDGGDSSFTLDKSGPFFFISGRVENCQNGEKLVVVVLLPNHRHKRGPSSSPSPAWNAPSPAWTPASNAPSPAWNAPSPAWTPASNAPSPASAWSAPSPALTPAKAPASKAPSPAWTPKSNAPSPSSSWSAPSPAWTPAKTPASNAPSTTWTPTSPAPSPAWTPASDAPSPTWSAPSPTPTWTPASDAPAPSATISNSPAPSPAHSSSTRFSGFGVGFGVGIAFIIGSFVI